ncbi:hypothetical protein ACHRV5_10595 [Flavobacterium sp. FlaQc-52]|jgi:hypothetical protein|uniref:hypothetical protein n=1 Tax=Flavobacterium sp. FlaQc-52 TaxID=3374185 RepID=UPI0037575738
MNTNHNRIKVADLETNGPDKILTTNTTGELKFSDLHSILVNDLITGGISKALTAEQGKVLKNLIDSLVTNKVDKIAGDRLITAAEITKLSGIQSGAEVNPDISGKQDIVNQIEVGTNQTIPSSWLGKTVVFNTSCTIAVPASLTESFIFNGITLPGVTVTWTITAPHTWLFGTPSATAEKQIFTFTKRGTTNSILLLGV